MISEQQFPGLVSTGIQELVRTAIRLGVSWNLRIGTVTEVTSTNLIKVRLDGDSESISVVSMIGDASIDGRVYVISVPPAGNFTIGAVDRIYPGQRIASSIRTSAVGPFTAETVIDTVVAPLIIGRRYKVYFTGEVQSSVADGFTRNRLRENSVTGTQMVIRQAPTTIGASQGIGFVMEAEYEAVATEDKTFVATSTRQAGTGNLTSNANATSPALLYVEYISG